MMSNLSTTAEKSKRSGSKEIKFENGVTKIKFISLFSLKA